MPVYSRRNSLRTGSALIEFTLSTIVWVPLLLGTIVVGLNISRAIEVTQICRDAAHMHAYGVDFSQAGNQQILVRLASDFNFAVKSGNGVIILSTIHLLAKADCDAAGVPNCANAGLPVFTRRLVIGNSQLRISDFGTPKSGSIDSGGNVTLNAYLNDATDRASGFSSLLALNSGQDAYVAETYFAFPDLDWPGFQTGSGSYARSVF